MSSKGSKIVPQKLKAIECGCGCKQALNGFDNRNRPRRFLPHHHRSHILGDPRYFANLSSRRHSDATKAKISRSRRGLTAKERNPNWKGGVTSEQRVARASRAYREWRKAVFERDNYTCRACQARGCILNADHILSFAQYPELRFDLNNGRTMCVPCHKMTWSYARNLS